jgi:hypothetical protein
MGLHGLLQGQLHIFFWSQETLREIYLRQQYSTFRGEEETLGDLKGSGAIRTDTRNRPRQPKSYSLKEYQGDEKKE